MDKKAKKRLDVLNKKLQKLQQQLAGAKQQMDEPEEAAREIWSLLERDLENGAVIDLYVPAD